MNDSELHFYNAFGKIINNATITDKDREVVITYISSKYNAELERFQEPDLSSVVEYLG